MTEAALGAEGPPGPVISAGVTPGTQTGVQGLRWSLGNSQGNTGNRCRTPLSHPRSFGTCFVGLSCGTCGNCVAIGLLLVHPSLEPVWQRGAAA
ncbi:hypothetical protein Y1Q_0011369 [Alligator mississippiensis]|uniref:Uncharacterized protein n=1 Tax=Alligator mississippiensis TaxID=8496 RepID=A0A151MI12_ALLMI|nr:hypothetical protein Y1Q_0011369 [Alligator mississippiensis]